MNLQIEKLIDELGEPFTVAIDLDTKVWDSMIGEIADAYTRPNFGEMVVGSPTFILVGPEWHTTRVKVVAGEVVFGWEDNYHKPGDPIYQAVLAAFKAAKAVTS